MISTTGGGDKRWPKRATIMEAERTMTAHTKTENFTGTVSGKAGGRFSGKLGRRIGARGRKAPALASLAVSEEVIDRLSREAGMRFEAQRDMPRHQLPPGLLDPVEPSGRPGLLAWCMIMAGLAGTPTRSRSAAQPAPY